MDFAAVLNALGGGAAVTTLLTVLWMLATGRLVTGSAYEQMRSDRDWYRERYSDGKAIREDRDWYRDRFAESTQMIGDLLETVEVEESDP